MTAFQKQKFYIIAHNPNTIDDVKAFLDAGANALEPDVCFSADDAGRYFVSHDHGASSNPFTAAHSLVTWLSQVRALITAKGNKYNLALIAFDYKDAPDCGSIKELLTIIHDNFSKFPICNGVAIMVTTSSIPEAKFINAYDQLTDNVGIGIDEEKDPTEVAKCFVDAKQHRFAYANGIIKTGIKLGVFKSILEAKGVQGAANGDRLKLIYTWIVESENTMRSFLNIHIDGMIVNLNSVAALKKILLEKEFFPMYELAKNGYNPWSAPPVPTYYVTIVTSNANLAGTDVPVRLTLTGALGSLTTIIDSSYKDIFEAGDITHTSFEGAYIGDIASIALTLLDSDINSDWLPALISVRYNLGGDAFFNFGPEDWVAFHHPLTKLAESAPNM